MPTPGSVELWLLEELGRDAESLAITPTANIRGSDKTQQYIVVLNALQRELYSWAENDLKGEYAKAVADTLEKAGKLGFDTAITQRDVLESEFTDVGEFTKRAKESFRLIKPGTLADIRQKKTTLTQEATRAYFRDANVGTRKEYMQKVMNDLSDKGIQSVRYSSGAKMNIREYSEMVARTNINNAGREAAMDTQRRMGNDLVRMTVHYPTCQYCAAYQGRVLSVTGRSSKYPSVDEARGYGALHPNCSHGLNPYYEGISDKEITVNQGELTKAQNEARYEFKRQQRYYERQVRKWKKRERSAITEEMSRKAEDKMESYRGRIRELVSSKSYLVRKPERETIF